MKSSFCIDLQRFMLIPTKFPLSLFLVLVVDKNKKGVGTILITRPTNRGLRIAQYS